MARWSMVAAVALLAVGLAAFGLRTFLEREPPPVQPPPIVDVPDPLSDTRPPPTKQAPAQYVDLTVLIEPAGADARMRLDGIPGATSPIRVRRGTRHVLEVSAPGFRDERVELRAERDQRVRVALQPAP